MPDNKFDSDDSFLISIVIPAYNEQAIIKDTINQTYEILKDLNFDFEIIIVNDGSKDLTENLVLELTDKLENTSIYSKKNGGFGSAVKVGITLAKGTYILCIPADNPLTKSEITNYITHSKNSDLVLGYRSKREGYTPRMVFNSKFLHFLVMQIFNVKANDFTWIHLYRREIFKFIDLNSDGVFMLPEVVIKASKKKLIISEIEINMKRRKHGKSSAASWKVAFITFYEFTKVIINYYFFNKIFPRNRASNPEE